MDDLTILKADALKFLTILRGQLPTPVILAAFGNLVALLGSDSNVVHSYAAIAIERLLASKVGPFLILHSLPVIQLERCQHHFNATAEALHMQCKICF